MPPAACSPATTAAAHAVFTTCKTALPQAGQKPGQVRPAGQPVLVWRTADDARRQHPALLAQRHRHQRQCHAGRLAGQTARRRPATSPPCPERTQRARRVIHHARPRFSGEEFRRRLPPGLHGQRPGWLGVDCRFLRALHRARPALPEPD